MAATHLSSHGAAAANPNSGMLMWDVIQDLWDADDNPNGYVKVGLAENALMHEELIEHLHTTISLPTQALTYGDGCAPRWRGSWPRGYDASRRSSRVTSS